MRQVEPAIQVNDISCFPAVWEENGTGQSLMIGSGPDLQSLIPVATGRLACVLHLPRCFMKSGRYNYMGVSKNRGTPKWMVYNGNSY